MIRRMMYMLAGLLVTMKLVLPAAAEQTGTIRIALEYPQAAAGAEVLLVAAGEAAEGGYRLKEAFGGGLIRREDACSPELALWLSERISWEWMEPDGEEADEAVFSGLDRGLYLAVQRSAPEGWACAAPFLIPMPLDGEWEVLARPKQAQLLTQSPRTGQHPAPLLGAMGLVLSGTALYFWVEKLWKK